MQQTLYVIPHVVFDGWLFYGWLAMGAIILAYLGWKYGFGQEMFGFLPVYLIVAAVIYWVVPQLEVTGFDNEPEGLAIRGYGVFMLLGITSGVSIAVTRCKRVGINTEQVLTMLFWTVVAGIVGARLFYVIQKFENFSGLPPREFITNVLDMTKGGLVVYGSLIGGAIAGGLYIWRTKLPALRVADAIAPGMVLGLALGRMGCLMNGCCFGGVCDPELPNIHFPPGSPPYMQQLTDGELIGIESSVNSAANDSRVVTSVLAGSPAEKLGIRKDDVVTVYPPDSLLVRAVKEDGLAVDGSATIQSQRVGFLELPIRDFPDYSLGVHPTQIYSSVNAFLLCLVLWFYFPFRKSDGEVFALMLILYAIGRFLLESIRTDELGVFGTPFTISQCVSFMILALGVLAFVYFRSRGPKTVVGAAVPEGLTG